MSFEEYDPACKILCTADGTCRKFVGKKAIEEMESNPEMFVGMVSPGRRTERGGTSQQEVVEPTALEFGVIASLEEKTTRRAKFWSEQQEKNAV